MNLFGLSFLLYILKWSAGKGFWYKRLINSQHFSDKSITPGGLPVIQNLQNLVR